MYDKIADLIFFQNHPKYVVPTAAFTFIGSQSMSALSYILLRTIVDDHDNLPSLTFEIRRIRNEIRKSIAGDLKWPHSLDFM